ncbi:hypothetical protein PPACK8108_LOCUS22956 [Phakopsora pachyrhizi]|uniref:Uncharacterized protein n=1 Tax=Phakopsora pachyrhizi TaxID=170000 RepID=A0AAV0BPT4_PHAPC|nr:hypothetical protein PPACK8108_LOCUS22956 [Phakopsora pachyrhizi]
MKIYTFHSKFATVLDDLSDRSLPTKAFSLQTHPLQPQPSNPQSDQVWFINPDHIVSQYQGCTECPLVSESHYKHGMGASFSFESENILKKLETRFALLERCKENENLMQCWSLTKSNFNNCSTRKPLPFLKYSNSRFSLPSPAETVENLSSSALNKGLSLALERKFSKSPCRTPPSRATASETNLSVPAANFSHLQALSNSGSALSERAFDDSENLSTKGENQNLSRKSRIKRQVEPNSVIGVSSFSEGPSDTSNAAFLNTGKRGSLSSTNYNGGTQSTGTTLDSRDSSLATSVSATALLPHHQVNYSSANGQITTNRSSNTSKSRNITGSEASLGFSAGLNKQGRNNKSSNLGPSKCKSSEGMHIPPVPPLPKDCEPFKASNYGSPQIQYPPHSTSQIKNSSTKADNQPPDSHLLFKVNTATSTLNLASSNPSLPPGGLVATSSSSTSATSRFLHSLSSHKTSEDSINLSATHITNSRSGKEENYTYQYCLASSVNQQQILDKLSAPLIEKSSRSPNARISLFTGNGKDDMNSKPFPLQSEPEDEVMSGGRGGRVSSVAAKWAKMAASEKAKLSGVEKSLSKSLRKGNDGSEALKSGASSGIFISNRAISIREREPKANALLKHIVSQDKGWTEFPLVSESHYKHGIGAGFLTAVSVVLNTRSFWTSGVGCLEHS